MAVLLPAQPAHDSSSAESWLFEKLKELPDDYCVLHSLGSMRHDHKSWSEIDFTVIGPAGIFFIEVKGGAIGRKNGEWFVERRDKRVESLGRGPFSQVAGAEASTRRFLQNRHVWLKEAVIGYWVVMPDCVFEVDDLGVDANAFYDSRNLGISSIDLITNMREYWKHRKGNDLVLDSTQVAEIRTSLCADVPMIKSLRKEIQDVAEKIYSATVEQEHVLQAVQSNMRLLVKGPAGSGKSTLAVHEVRAQASEGKNVLFVCSSPNMARRISNQFDDVMNVDVASSQDVLFETRNYRDQYDVLVIDEAQDLLSDRLFKILDRFLFGGIEGGTWRMFLDPFQSVLFEGRTLESEFSYIGHPSVMNLKDNVRTTVEIAVAASALGYVNNISCGIHGPEVDFTYIEKTDIRKKVKEKVLELRGNGLSVDEIIVLSFNEDSFWLEGELKGLTVPLGSPKSDEMINYATVYQAKGLESVAVILVGIDELSSPAARQQTYIGATRASTILVLITELGLRVKVGEAYAALALRSQK